jgi:regulatory protein
MPGRSRSSNRPPEEAAFELALRALNRRERTVAEISAWLSERGFEPEPIGAVLERLVDSGALDDARFARVFAEDKRALAGWGSERIRGDLEARGVAPSLIEAALGPASHENEVERATELVAERGDPLTSDAARGRALAFLVRRGYGSEVAYDAVRRAERNAAGLAIK